MMVPTAEAYAQLEQKLDRVLALMESAQAPAVDLPSLGLEPMRVYTAKEAAHCSDPSKSSHQS